MLVSMLVSVQAMAQAVSLFIRFSNGSLSSYPLVQVKKISFDNDFVKLQLQDGTLYSWAASTIDHYKYDQVTSVKEISSSYNPWELRVIPNPSEGNQTLRFRLPAGGDLALKVFDAAGKAVLEKQYNQLPAGEQELNLNWNAIPGNYRLLLQTKDFSVSKAIIRR